MEEGPLFHQFPEYQIVFAALLTKARSGKLDLDSLRKILWQGPELNDKDYKRIKELKDIKASELSSELKNLGITSVSLEEIENCLKFYFNPDASTQRILKIISSYGFMTLSLFEARIKSTGLQLPQFPLLDYLSYLQLVKRQEERFWADKRRMQLVWDFLKEEDYRVVFSSKGP